MHVVCPSGLEGEVRKLKGSEANILADRTAQRKGETYDRILRACWTATDAVGPYERVHVAAGTTSIPWGKILICDRSHILAAIRIKTYGSVYVFPIKCDNENCGHKFEWQVDIEKDLPLVDLPDESRKKIKEGENEFEAALDGRKITFKLLNGDDEKRAGRKAQSNRSELFTLTLAARTTSIERVDRYEIQKFYNNLDLDVQLELLDEFEKVDGGFDTTIEVECQRCDNVFEIEIPLEGADFWLPRSVMRRKSSKAERTGRKSRTMATSTTDQ